MDWYYEKGEVHVSIPGYVAAALKQFKHEPPSKLQNQPHPYNPKQYGAKSQIAKPLDNSSLLSKKGKKLVHEIMGTFHFMQERFMVQQC
jgi:hypothetical protein